MRSNHTVFHSVGTDFHSHQQYLKVSFFLHPCQDLFFSNSHPNMCEMISNCDFDLNSLMITNVQHLFICLVVIYMLSLEKCLFKIHLKLNYLRKLCLENPWTITAGVQWSTPFPISSRGDFQLIFSYFWIFLNLVELDFIL